MLSKFYGGRHKRLGVFCLAILLGPLCLLPAFAGPLAKDPKPAAKDAADKPKEWDVDHYTKETSEVAIQTDEGTWMNLDVSPDGQTIVFDMLGDLYTIPISGGDATQLTSGMAWDMQPRFSPDGKRIAFTSDRAGGDNIWVMNRDGKSPVQITAETFRLLNSPTWSPDGNYIAAHKHFSSSRSLGSGEIWLYHANGKSDGIQLNEKPNKQKDLGEPAFSPDGLYVYFSQDTTPGGVFEYSKDPNPGIYSIKRIDREKGDIETVISGAGGAIRPTPSPDGRFLAYVRRHEYKTMLFVFDLTTFKSQLIYDNLERDLQETWAIHGVYPTIAWTPDNQNLVFWARGKIHKIAVDSKDHQAIPFKVNTTRTVAKSVRFPVTVAPETFKTKMLRWATVSPKGDQVIFQALGYLYLKDLPNGTPKRLTSQTDHFEFYPSWSRDGSRITYTTWNDTEMGSLRVIAANGQGPSTVLTTAPGHYLNPTFSPDGSLITYEKIAGGVLTGELYGNLPGIYVLNLKEQKTERIVDHGDLPHFGATSDRVFFVTDGEEGERTLESISVLGKDQREHFTSAMGDELRVSPDGKWLAFVENYNAYITPFVWAPKKFTISPEGSNLPTTKVSVDAGTFLNWSGDANRLYWTLGPNLFYRDLKDAFAFQQGAPEKLPEPGGTAIPLDFELKHDVPTGIVAFKGARIVTMKGDEVLENGVIVVEGNRILAVGSADAVQIPAEAYVVDASGKTIIPGLVDVHAHAQYGTAELVPQQNWQTYATLAFGVTTTHNPSTDTSLAFSTTDMTMAGLLSGPRVFSTGAILYGAHAPTLTAKIDSLDDARSHLRRLKDVGAFSVKSYNQPRRNQRQQVLEAARLEHMMVVPEGGSLYQHNMNMIVDGHTGIEHSIPMEVLYKDVVSLWAGTEVGYTPTLGVAYGGISGEHYWYQETNVWEHPILSLHVPPYILEARSRRRTMAPKMEYNHIRVSEGCKKLADAGVRVNLGAHGQREGLAAHWEMWMLAQGGMTPMQVLQSATINGAHYLGMDKDIGSLEKGKLADLVVLETNPLENIYTSDKVALVMVNGRLFDAHTMDQTGNHPKPRKPYFWEGAGAGYPVSTTSTIMQDTCGGMCKH